MLRLDGVDDELVEFLRTIPPSVDIGAVLGDRVKDPDLVLLLTDLWERPDHHVSAFADGGAPSVGDVIIDVEELGERLSSPDSETEAIVVTPHQIARLLSGTIEDWMVYLHPDQRATAKADFNGPARVRGGPGTGKTVVALHRARYVARHLDAGEQVLLTTFLRTLPAVWEGLMGLLDKKALESLKIANLDSLAWGICARAGMNLKVVHEGERKAIGRQLIDRHGLSGRLAGNADLLLEEFDAFLSGRGITKLEDYLAIDRRGGGSPLARADRERVFAAYTDYLERLEGRVETDHHLIRLKALQLAEAGQGPRFAGVVVDEAQDLTEVGIKLLIALDQSENHRQMMVVGDGQQSIYPGGFSLRSIGLDVRGRSRVLTSNWRNTWSIWTAAKAVVGDEDFDDLDDDVGLRPTGEEPAPLTVGEPTVLHVVKSPGEELDLLATIVAERIEAGVDPGDIAVLVDAKPSEVEAMLKAEGIPTAPLAEYAGEHAGGVLVGTLNRAKGLEFKEVIVPGLSAAEWPPRWLVPAGLPDEQRAERLSLVRRKLFVGMTRARDRLQLLSGGGPADDIERARWAMDVREY